MYIPGDFSNLLRQKVFERRNCFCWEHLGCDIVTAAVTELPSTESVCLERGCRRQEYCIYIKIELKNKQAFLVL